MSARVAMDGIEQLRWALRKLPQDLHEEAIVIVRAHADECARITRAAYPIGPTGNLVRGVTVEHNSSKFFSQAIVRSRAKHSYIFENGTRERRTNNNVSRGAMPQAEESQRFIPKAIRVRQRMVRALIDMVRRYGLEVPD